MGEKASLNLGQRYWYIVLKGKSYTRTHAKSILGHALVLWLRILNSSFLLLYFFNILLSLSLSFSSSLPFFSPFRWILFHIIYYVFYTISSIHVWVRCWESFFSVLPCLSLNLLLLAVRLLVYCSGIIFTLMRPES